MNKTFVRITNQQVYDELENLKSSNSRQHEEIMKMIGNYNSRLARVYWLFYGCLVFITGIFVKTFVKGGI